MKALTNCELIQQLLELRQPHAIVEVHGCVTCDEEHKGYHDIVAKLQVVGVRSLMNKVILEVTE